MSCCEVYFHRQNTTSWAAQLHKAYRRKEGECQHRVYDCIFILNCPPAPSIASTMDGISVASSVTGLLQAGERVIGFLSAMADAPSTARDVLAEVHALQAIFRQLDGFISAPSQQSTARKSRIQLHDLVLTLTDCVKTFSELDLELRRLGAADSRIADVIALTTWERTKWAMKENNIAKILRHLQMHKASLGLMFSIYSRFVCPFHHPAFFRHVHL